MNTATDSRRSARPASYRTVSLARRAYNLLEEMILTLRLEPGCIVTEQELIRMTGLGRTPIREALLQLGREKLVEVLPRKGIMVCDINIAQHLTLLEARRVLDRLIAENAALRATPVQRAHLKRIAAAMEQEAARKHLVEFMRLDREFDAILEAAARNPFAVQAVKPMHAHCRRFWFLFRHHADIGKAAGFHARLMRSVASGKRKETGKASDELLDYLGQFARRALELM